ncbi:hypothetical protein R1flu_012066 [Riccia fluitans]|uniref:Uncharacterized protein n=1 Tax=Riccia fluitans TaxID=41844 RepID=A0ABD1ZC07_9MARC
MRGELEHGCDSYKQERVRWKAITKSASALSRPPGSDGLDNFLWLSAAAFILYYGDSHSSFFSVLTSNPRVIRRPFLVGVLCVGVNTVIFFYLAVWLRHIKKKTEPWEYIAPGAIPTATILGVAAFFMFMFALWPVWGFFTLPLMVTLFMAFLDIPLLLQAHDSRFSYGAMQQFYNWVPEWEVYLTQSQDLEFHRKHSRARKTTNHLVSVDEH